MKIKETPTFVQDMVKERLIEVYPNNTEMVNTIIHLSTIYTIGEYLPEMDALKNLTSAMNELKNISYRISKGKSCDTLIAGAYRKLQGETLATYELLLKSIILDKIGGRI